MEGKILEDPSSEYARIALLDLPFQKTTLPEEEVSNEPITPTPGEHGEISLIILVTFTINAHAH